MWDAIPPTEPLLKRAANARAIVYGSLAQRSAVTRGTIERLWHSEALMVFDLNLRPPYEDRGIISRSLRRADIVKISQHELRRPGATALAAYVLYAPAAAWLERPVAVAYARGFSEGVIERTS